jgi:hypothetical protein
LAAAPWQSSSLGAEQHSSTALSAATRAQAATQRARARRPARQAATALLLLCVRCGRRRPLLCQSWFCCGCGCGGAGGGGGCFACLPRLRLRRLCCSGVRSGAVAAAAAAAAQTCAASAALLLRVLERASQPALGCAVAQRALAE